ncbi:RagB/SusD family nutrient uptake outer membrane protein [Flavivirga aquimarina]|uniref:RagB/SusD family nutrient uptake outer membrane protein n=1 Tax=Flavivirga aquimarina TaxID=2027862 RepID=A0ABT8WE00_9FLAO|nr:RagB/SusD family nutrient uptake outer membrane protein [Flavivirga aquimarina]MDO5971287.1 RagB/SusD family nutrient uptake outer membrane protein [Flavivirga aquimarina]
MKKFKIFIASILVVVGILISCDESKIDLLDPNESSVEAFFTSTVQLQSAVTAPYTFLQAEGNYSRYQFYINDNIAGENYAVGNLEADKKDMIDRQVKVSNNGSNLYWQHNYQGIGRCNFVIENEPNFKNIPDNIITTSIAEVRFLRGLFYFNLVAKYGEIPLVLDLDPDKVKGGRPKSPIADIYNAIVADLEFAAANLPAKGTQENGRPTSGAAWALLGKVLLQSDDAAGAKTALANVTGYSLVDEYTDNFTVAGEHNDESIFEVHFDESKGVGDAWSLRDGTGNAETTFRAQEYSGWFNVKPSQTLLDEYEDDDMRYAFTFYSLDASDNGTMTDTFNNGESRYVAHDLGVADENDNLISIGEDGNPAWRKYQNLDNRPSETPSSGINARVLRYADVLLMKAEAEIRSGGSEAVALGFLNEVRARPSVSMDPVNVTGTDAILDAIKHERWVELAGEQSRWLDLQRFDNDPYLMPIPNKELTGNPNL